MATDCFGRSGEFAIPMLGAMALHSLSRLFAFSNLKILYGEACQKEQHSWPSKMRSVWAKRVPQQARPKLPARYEGTFAVSSSRMPNGIAIGETWKFPFTKAFENAVVDVIAKVPKCQSLSC